MPLNGGFSVLDASGNIKVAQTITTVATAVPSSVNQVISVATTITSGTDTVVPVSLEIAAGIQLEVGDGAILEIFTSTKEKSGKIDLSVENGQSISATVTLATEGSIDWLAPVVATQPMLSVATPHFKGSGGWLHRSFQWMSVNNTGTAVSTFSSGVSMTSAAGDDASNAALLSSTVTGLLTSQNADGLGWTLRFPCNLTKQVMRIYCGVFACDATITVKLRSGAVPTKSYFVRNTSTVSVGRAENYKITFYGDPGDELIVTYSSSGKTGTTPNVTFICATVGTT
jgi:hypothetical protein